jgi:hypothetical protein
MSVGVSPDTLNAGSTSGSGGARNSRGGGWHSKHGHALRSSGQGHCRTRWLLSVRARLDSQDTRPPKDTFVNVRGLKDSGEVILSYGRATILSGTIVSLPSEEAEPLIRDGTVELVEWDDGFGRNRQ